MTADKEKIKDILSRGVVDVIDKDHLEKKMLAGEKLRVKYGIDPTGPNIHIGRGTNIKKLKEFQDLGHQVVLIVGDATARIGDSSDKMSKREMLSGEQIKKNEEKYLEQIGKILDIKKTEIHHNSEWSDKFSLTELVNLASLFTIQQMTERENFSQRIKTGDPVGLHEPLYSLVQGYDSVAIKADVEIGGTDQLFNLLAGRKIQKHFGMEEQDILTLQLLAGTDGRKMSTSWGNTVLFIDDPKEKYGRIMRISDQLIPIYMESSTSIPMKRVKEVQEIIENGDQNPMEFKKELAFAVVELYDGKTNAEEAQKHFENTVQGGELPESIPSVEIKNGDLDLADFLSLLVKANLIKSKSEGRRLIAEGAVSIDNKTLLEGDIKIKLTNDSVVKVGKRRFLNINLN